jgi:hypothetical protein
VSNDTNEFIDSPPRQNPVNIEIEGIELYVEYIDGEQIDAPTDLAQFGFVDVGGNAIRTKEGEIFIIDTGDDKNFNIPIGDPREAFRGKIFNFAPIISIIEIDLSK